MATPGVLIDGACVIEAEAPSAFFSTQQAVTWVDSGTVHRAYFRYASGNWEHVTEAYPGGVVDVQAAVLPSLPPCDYTEGFTDGMQVGWGIAAALVAVAAFKMMLKGAR